MDKNVVLLRAGFCCTFLLSNSIVLFWADLAGKVMEALERETEISGAMVRLSCFFILSLCGYIFLIFADRKLISAFERGFLPIQERYIERDLMRSGRSKRYSELELINRASDDLRTVFEWVCRQKRN